VLDKDVNARQDLRASGALPAITGMVVVRWQSSQAHGLTGLGTHTDAARWRKA
jgi:hypothetical protein